MLMCFLSLVIRGGRALNSVIPIALCFTQIVYYFCDVSKGKSSQCPVIWRLSKSEIFSKTDTDL